MCFEIPHNSVRVTFFADSIFVFSINEAMFLYSQFNREVSWFVNMLTIGADVYRVNSNPAVEVQNDSPKCKVKI